ncbi:hypothetical protein VNO80_01347 [Phaseolus coccineus]|uniref:Uncharacterized protein n=1 Tax=Phaseolus coccineus TaxID=3886 RepID=A0AAN9RSS4_PHACN
MSIDNLVFTCKAHKDATFRFCFTSAAVALRNHRCLYSSIVLQMIIWSHQKETALLKPPEAFQPAYGIGVLVILENLYTVILGYFEPLSITKPS